LRPIAERLDVSQAQLALAWLLHRDGLTGVIVGSRSSQHVRENVGASHVQLSTESLAEIDSILQHRAELVVP
jgi:aryl-alcohol dehydrogenase-like predicted oxidoreductase